MDGAAYCYIGMEYGTDHFIMNSVFRVLLRASYFTKQRTRRRLLVEGPPRVDITRGFLGKRRRSAAKAVGSVQDIAVDRPAQRLEAERALEGVFDPVPDFADPVQQPRRQGQYGSHSVPQLPHHRKRQSEEPQRQASEQVAG